MGLTSTARVFPGSVLRSLQLDELRDQLKRQEATSERQADRSGGKTKEVLGMVVGNWSDDSVLLLLLLLLVLVLLVLVLLVVVVVDDVDVDVDVESLGEAQELNRMRTDFPKPKSVQR